MIDLQTLMFSLLVVEGLLAILLLLTVKIQKNYPGFNIWSVSLVILTISTALLLLRTHIPDILSILAGNLLLLLSLLLMTESLHRFFTNVPLNRLYYLILLPVAFLISYYTLFDNNISIRSLIFSIASILIIIITIQVIRKNAPKGNIPSRILMVVLSILAIVMAVRGIDWLLTPAGRYLFEPSALNVGLYVVAIITLLSISFMYLLLNFHRLADELNQSNARASTLLTDLDIRNKDLEQATTRLEVMNQELDQIVQDRTKRIENLLLQKDHFINQIAHDLRTPLTPLVALMPILKRSIHDKESMELVDLIDQNVNFLHSMTNQVIKLARLNSQCVITDYHEINLLTLIQEAISSNSIQIHDYDITVVVKVPGDLTVCVSKVLGNTIFSNLINNAVKYNKISGRITITGEADEENVLVTITDTGIGMNSETIEKIWDELYISDESRSDPISKGLGLSMVRKIVALHGGDISVVSPGLNDGSTFVVRLPRFSPDECGTTEDK